MDVKIITRSAWFASLALALAVAQPSLAAEAIASDAEVSSAVFISDEAESEPPGLPKSVAGSVVFIEDTPTVSPPPVKQTSVALAEPASDLSVPSVPQGELRVISNRSNQATLEAISSQPIPQSQAPVAIQPVAPAMTLQASSVHKPTEREQPGDIEIAVHSEPATATATNPVSTSPVKPHEELLILAHQLSLEANTLEDYTQIIEASDEAIQVGAIAENRQFARQLASWALNRRGQMHADAGDQESASADFLAATELNSRNWRAIHNRGVSYAQEGQFAEAFDDFNRVIQLNPAYAKAYANRATLYVQAKDLHSAMKDYELAIQQDSEFATAFVGLGRVCHLLGRWDDAIQHFNTAVELAPDSPDISCSRGDLQADMGNYGEALADYARTIELDPEFAHAYRNGAWLLATCPDQRYRDPENAVLGARQALQYSYGDRHVALDTLAAALASNGQFEEAIATLNEAVELAPEGTKETYLARMDLYQANQPFRTEPVGEVTQVGYEED